MGLDQLADEDELHHRGGAADIESVFEVAPWDRVQRPADLGVDVRTDPRTGLGGQHERRGRQRSQRRRLNSGEHHRGRGTLQWPARPGTSSQAYNEFWHGTGCQLNAQLLRAGLRSHQLSPKAHHQRGEHLKGGSWLIDRHTQTLRTQDQFSQHLRSTRRVPHDLGRITHAPDDQLR
jgi:hypothetical protein